MITKIQLVTIIWELVKGDESSSKIRSDSNFFRNSLAENEWIYFKEIEISLSHIFEEMQSGRFKFSGDLIQAILSGKIDPQFQANKYVLGKVKDCQIAIEMLSNP